MLTHDCYLLLMNSMDGFIAEMERMGDQDPPRMLREHAKFLLATLYGAILSLVHGGTDLLSMSLACQVFEEFHSARVKEAACLGAWKGERLDEHLERQYEAFGEDAVLEATELQQEKAHAYGWMLNLRSAFIEVAKRPEQERTAENVREAFLRKTEAINTFKAAQYPKDVLHDLDELEVSYNRLNNG